MKDKYLLGIDLGTSGVKVGLYGQELSPVALERASSYTIDSPHPGWSQSNPEAWWNDICTAIKAARRSSDVPAEDIAAVGLSVFIPSITPLTQDLQSLHQTIMYNDQRSVDQIDDIAQLTDRDEYQRRIGNVIATGMCVATSIRWLQENESSVYERCHTLASANTYVSAKLTGELVTDPSHVSLSGLAEMLDPRVWSAELCDLLDVDKEKLPRIAAAGEIVGVVTDIASGETGLKSGTPVVCGTGDALAGTLGAGVYEAGEMCYVSGTSDSFVVPLPKPLVDLKWLNVAFCERDSYIGGGAVTSSGRCVAWFLDTFFGHMSRDAAFAKFFELARIPAENEGSILFQPYIQGERTPIWDSLARGSFVGITSATTLADLARSVLEGTALALKDVLQSLPKENQGALEQIVAVGGTTKNALWNQIKADAIQKPIRVLDNPETTCLGSALLAGVGAGWFSSYAEAAKEAKRNTRYTLIEPDASRADRYEFLYQRYKELYEGTKDLVHSLARGFVP
jgi:xylulokinase